MTRECADRLAINRRVVGVELDEHVLLQIVVRQIFGPNHSSAWQRNTFDRFGREFDEHEGAVVMAMDDREVGHKVAQSDGDRE